MLYGILYLNPNFDSILSPPMDILFLLQVIGHPRDSKRITHLQSFGHNVFALAFSRQTKAFRKLTCNYEYIGTISNREYLKRILVFLFALPRIRAQARHYDLIYASGQDVGLLALLACISLNKPIGLEVGDLTKIQTARSMLGFVIRRLDSLTCIHYKFIVVISESFRDVYYKQWLGIKSCFIVIANKPLFLDNTSTIRLEKPKSYHALMKQDSRIRIGYFGLIRDHWSLSVLDTLANLYGSRFSVYIAGSPSDSVTETDLFERYNNVCYLGPYSNPEDLDCLYTGIDLVWACYPPLRTEDWNMRWGRPNRFYESCIFRKPCIGRHATLYGNDIEQFNIGLTLEASSILEAVNVLAKVSREQVVLWTESYTRLPSSFTTSKEEVASLAALVNSFQTSIV